MPDTASARIDALIADLADWRGPMLGRLRAIVNKAAPELEEAWKWDTAVWVAKGNVCALGVFKEHVGLNFFQGASLPDPGGLFNAGLDAKLSRVVQFREGAKVDAVALRDLVRGAAAHNIAGKKK